MPEDLYSEDNQFWFAGYQDESGNYYDLQEESRAVKYGDEIEVRWDKWERFNDDHRDEYKVEFENADHVVIGWIDADGIVNYATLPGGVDLDYFDFETWVEDYG